MEDWRKPYEEALSKRKKFLQKASDEALKESEKRKEEERSRLAKIPGTPEFRSEQKKLAFVADQKKYAERYKCCIEGCTSVALAREITVMAGDSDYSGTPWGPRIVGTGRYIWDSPPESYRICVKCQRVFCNMHSTDEFYHGPNSTCVFCAKEELKSGSIILSSELADEIIPDELQEQKSPSGMIVFLYIIAGILILAFCGGIALVVLFIAWLLLML